MVCFEFENLAKDTFVGLNFYSNTFRKSRTYLNYMTIDINNNKINSYF